MSSIIQAIILGVIQGLTEFIPVSSSGHLIAVPRLMGWQDMGLSFDVALHLGTLVAVIAYFRKDWVRILSGFIGRRRHTQITAESRLLIPILVACVPAAIVGYLWDDFIEQTLRQWYWVAGALVLIAFVMLAAERVSKRTRSLAEMNYVDYVIIGCAQALALFPGVSRSGITITAGLFRDIERATAARFSFLMSTPIIVGAGVLKLKDVFQAGLPADEVVLFVVGFVAAALSGYAAIRFLMNYLRRASLNVFIVYRIAFAAFMAVVFLTRP